MAREQESGSERRCASICALVEEISLRDYCGRSLPECRRGAARMFDRMGRASEYGGVVSPNDTRH